MGIGVQGERAQQLKGKIQPHRIPSLPPAMPKIRIFPVTPQNTPDPIMLACVAWGFYPGDVNITWLWNGDPVKDHLDPPLVTSNGDWSYQARLTLPVNPRQGGTYTCSVQHTSLSEPLTEDWGEWGQGLARGRKWWALL